ncbi:hypothetical protein CK203_112914 [Vitis vinifera]|uniref:Retrotransposon Copia-like N-terminal domain-containing protein n=1 Tax=Vitis vinifera TaxID=29760 RepID=A0A438CBG3_VITVI|nr:hypothetical protein CK203_112914 [Vitis vinifera]
MQDTLDKTLSNLLRLPDAFQKVEVIRKVINKTSLPKNRLKIVPYYFLNSDLVIGGSEGILPSTPTEVNGKSICNDVHKDAESISIVTKQKAAANELAMFVSMSLPRPALLKSSSGQFKHDGTREARFQGALEEKDKVLSILSMVNLSYDSSSCYYLHPFDNPGALLVSEISTGENIAWSRSMSIALTVKNKIAFVDGSLVQPITNDPHLHVAWLRANNLVLSWLMNSIAKNLW